MTKLSKPATHPARPRHHDCDEVEDEIARLLQRRDCKDSQHQVVSLAARHYAPELRRFLVLRMSDEDDAGDVLAMTLEDLVKGIATFAGRCTFRAWLYVLAKNARARFYREPYRHRGRRLETSEISGLVGPDVSETPKLARLDAERVRSALSDDDQELLTLYFERQLTWQEIAAIWSSDRPALKAVSLRVRCHRLLGELKRQWHSSPTGGS